MRFVSVTASPGSARRTQISRPSPSTKSHHPVCGEVHLSYSGRDREIVYRKSTEVADFNQEILSLKKIGRQLQVYTESNRRSLPEYEGVAWL
jgi:hypothetical protein